MQTHTAGELIGLERGAEQFDALVTAHNLDIHHRHRFPPQSFIDAATEIIETVRHGRRNQIPDEVWRWLLAGGRLTAFHHRWPDLGKTVHLLGLHVSTLTGLYDYILYKNSVEYNGALSGDLVGSKGRGFDELECEGGADWTVDQRVNG